MEFPDAEYMSDVSGSGGCGAFWGSQWLQIQWVPGSVQLAASIGAKEFFLLLAGIMWGEAWHRGTIRCK